jgi:hypothetical protein
MALVIETGVLPKDDARLASRTVSRVLCPSNLKSLEVGRMAAIHLGPRLLEASSDQPEGGPGRPLPSYLVLLRVGFTQSFLRRRRPKDPPCEGPAGHPAAGALLPHRFTLTLPASTTLKSEGRSVSVALSVASPRLGVTQHPALWSSDFPPSFGKKESGRPSS